MKQHLGCSLSDGVSLLYTVVQIFHLPIVGQTGAVGSDTQHQSLSSTLYEKAALTQLFLSIIVQLEVVKIGFFGFSLGLVTYNLASSTVNETLHSSNPIHISWIETVLSFGDSTCSSA